MTLAEWRVVEEDGGGREEVERQAGWGLGVSNPRGILAGLYMSRKTIQKYYSNKIY